MIGVLTHHWAKEDKIQEAKDLLDRNGLAQSKALGFGSRQTLFSLNDPTKITTLVTWESNEIYDAWRASPERSVAMAGAEELWAQPPASERFEVAGERRPRGALTPQVSAGFGLDLGMEWLPMSLDLNSWIRPL